MQQLRDIWRTAGLTVLTHGRPSRPTSPISTTLAPTDHSTSRRFPLLWLMPIGCSLWASSPSTEELLLAYRVGFALIATNWNSQIRELLYIMNTWWDLR